MAALVGMLTGIGGGVMRDLLLSRVPVVFQSDIYALAALAGATVVVLGNWLHWPQVPTAIAGALLLRPSLYWIPNGIPQLGLGQTVYSTAFPLERPGRLLIALARVMIDRLDELTAVRRENARALMTGLAQVPGIRALTPVAGAEPAYLRLPLLAADATARDRALLALRDAGIGASASYPQSIADVPELASLLADPRPRADGGRHVARHILTLPTHPYVTRADISLMVSVLAGVADDHQAVVALPT